MRPNASETFGVKWFFAADDAEVFDFPTAFGSSRFNVDAVDYDGLGEIWERNPPLSNYVRPAWLKGTHICGTAGQWQNGYPVGSPLPIVGPDGLPVCCGIAPAAYDFGFDLGFDS